MASEKWVPLKHWYQTVNSVLKQEDGSYFIVLENRATVHFPASAYGSLNQVAPKDRLLVDASDWREKGIAHLFFFRDARVICQFGAGKAGCVFSPDVF